MSSRSRAIRGTSSRRAASSDKRRKPKLKKSLSYGKKKRGARPGLRRAKTSTRLALSWAKGPGTATTATSTANAAHSPPSPHSQARRGSDTTLHTEDIHAALLGSTGGVDEKLVTTPSVASSGSTESVLASAVEELDRLMTAGHLACPMYGTWRQLTFYLLHPYADDKHYQDAFLFTYVDFAQPEQLVKEICRHLNMPPPKPKGLVQVVGSAGVDSSRAMPDINSSKIFKRQKERILALLEAWMDQHPSDFSDQVVTLLRVLGGNLPQEWITQLHPEVLSDMFQIYASFHRLLDSAADRRQRDLTKAKGKTRRAQNPSVNFLRKFTEISLSNDILGFDPQVVAGQLTLMQNERFCHIRPREFLDMQHLKGNTSNTHWAAAPTVLSYVAFHNKVSWWVTQSVLQKEKWPARTKSVEFFIEVAGHCAAFGNFEGCFAVVGGLSWPLVRRMKQVWEKLDKKRTAQWTTLAELCAPDNCYENYRKAYQTRMDQNAPRIPFLGLLIGSLKGLRPQRDTVVETNNSTLTKKASNTQHTLQSSRSSLLIDFARYLQLFDIVQRVVHTQQRGFAIVRDHRVQVLLSEGIMLMEPHDNGQLYLSYADTSLLSTPRVEHGTVDDLIEYLFSSFGRDVEFRDAFFLTYQSFTTPQHFLDALFAEIREAPPEECGDHKAQPVVLEDVDADERKAAMAFKARKVALIQLLQHWMWDYPSDFTESMLQSVEKTTSALPPPEWEARLPIDVSEALEGCFNDVKTSMSTAEHRRKMQHRSTKVRRLSSNPRASFLKRAVDKGPSSSRLVSLKPVLVAEQLTLIQMEMVVAIAPRELTQCRWMDKEHKWDHSPGVLTCIVHHNKTSMWVAEEVVQEEDTERRLGLMEWFIDVADHSAALGNFDTAFAIAGGLSATPVYRLKFTWQKLPKAYQKRWKSLQELISPSNNYNTYRQRVGELQQAHKAVVPFLGIVLTELVRVDSLPSTSEISRSASGLPSTLPRPSRSHSSASTTDSNPSTELKTSALGTTSSEMGDSSHYLSSADAPAPGPELPLHSVDSSRRSSIGASGTSSGGATAAAGRSGRCRIQTIEFSHLLRTHKLIQRVVSAQKVEFPFKADYEVQMLLREAIMKSEVKDEKMLYRFSLEVEPRNKAERDFKEMVDILSLAGF